MPRNLLIFISILISIMISWILFSSIYNPDNHDFMTEATSYYFKQMSEIGETKHASYSDCSLSKADDTEISQGVVMFGICKSESETTVYHYSIAMGPTGKYVYSDFDEVRK
jgi:hypothetical protein